jgi:hypothetical protein
MRWIFITLVCMNLGYLAWQLYLQRVAQPKAAKEYLSEAGNLRMLSELPQKSSQELQSIATIPIQKPPVPDSSDSGPIEKPLAEENSVSDSIEQPLAGENRISDPIENPLVEEISDGECLTIGPFPDIFAGRQVVNQLASLDMKTEVKSIDEATGDNDYRVLIPPLNSLQESYRKLRELKARNIDSYVLTAGANALGISLGVFTSYPLALQTRDKIEKDGYTVALVEIPRIHREYWLYPVAGSDLMVEDIWWEILVKQHPNIEKRILRCE